MGGSSSTSANVAGAGTGKACEKPGRQALVVLQDEGLAATIPVQQWHGAALYQHFARPATQSLAGIQTMLFHELPEKRCEMPPFLCNAKGVNTAPHEGPILNLNRPTWLVPQTANELIFHHDITKHVRICAVVRH